MIGLIKSEAPQRATSRSALSYEEVACRHLDYCRSHDWAGYDPYDALNSPIFSAVPVLDSKLPRLIATQVLKRSPINVRSLLRIPATQNPKALGLFIMAVLKLERAGLTNLSLANELANEVEGLRSSDHRYWSWGYSFPWQGRELYVPRWAPNLVCTTFVAEALLNLYDETGDQRYLSMAESAAHYLKELFWADGEVASFSYPHPSARSRVHNANLLAAALLCRVSSYTQEAALAETGLRAARYSTGRQNQDGSWYYGELPTQRWIDNFHTGFNLVALANLRDYSGSAEFDASIARGFQFYCDNFFTENGAPKYFHDRIHPIDVHSVAQSIITLLRLGGMMQNGKQTADTVFAWAMTNLWDDRGYFYYQVQPAYTNRIPFMRWGQAWMLLALASLVDCSGQRREANPVHG